MELEVNGMDVVDSDDEVLTESSTDEDGDEPDFVDDVVNEKENEDTKIPKESFSDDAEVRDEESTDPAGAPEEVPIKRPPNPSDTTPEEREAHMARHLPYRGWCPVCVKARGKEDAHYKMTK